MKFFEKANELIFRFAKKLRLFYKPVIVAIDFNDTPYYGDKDHPMLVETKQTRGTTRVFRFATLDIVEGGRRFTLAIMPVSQLTSKKKAIERLLETASRYVRIKLVLLDRWFFDVETINTFHRLGYFYLTARKTSKVKETALKSLENHEFIVEYELKASDGSTAKTFLVILEDEKHDYIVFSTNQK